MAEEDSEWDAYSVYAEISTEVAESVFEAIRAYHRIDRRHRENVSVGPEQAAEAGAKLQSAAQLVLTEIRNEATAGDAEQNVYDRILDRWINGTDAAPNGYLAALDDVRLQRQAPPWLSQYTTDLHRAAWELGYLRAGRYEEPDRTGPEAEADEMTLDLAQHATSSADA